MGQATNTEVLHGDNIRGGRRVSGATTSKVDVGQLGIIMRTCDAHCQSAKDEKDTKPVVHSFEGVLDIDTRSLGFSRYHGDILGTDDSESSAEQRG